LHRRSASLKGAAAKKIAAKLVAAGLVQEIKTKSGAHVWRQDDATGRAYSLQLTSIGLAAIAVDEAEAAEATSEIFPTLLGEGRKDLDPAVGSSALPTAIAAPREGSKLAQVIGLMRREGGATIDQLAHAMGWLPHTTRAALTGLRKRGFGIDRCKANDGRAGAYVIVDQPKAVER
jgi:hypothetical protein